MKSIRIPMIAFETVKSPPRRPRTVDDLLNVFVGALNANEYGVKPDTADARGMTVVDSRTGLLYRLWLTDDGILDDAEWQRLSDAVEARDLWETQQEASWLKKQSDRLARRRRHGQNQDRLRRGPW
jgi:hypothetical protein